MVQMAKPPLSYGAMALMGQTLDNQPVYDDANITTALNNALAGYLNPAQNDQDEMLAMAGGMRDPAGHGSFGGALTAGFKAQSEQRTKNKELVGQYVPQIVNTMLAQRAMTQTQSMMQAMTGPQGGSWIQQVSEQFGLAPEMIYADLMTNGGKKIAEMIQKNSTPDIQLQDGAYIDKNPYTNGMYAAARRNAQSTGEMRQPGQGVAGSMQPFSWTPGMTTSQTGESSMRIPDPSAPGGVRVMAPEGALHTRGNYLQQGERIKAENDPMTVQPQGEPPQLTTRANALDRARGVQGGAPQGGNVFMPQPPMARGTGAPGGVFGGPPEQLVGGFARGSDGLVDIQRAMRDVNAMTDPAQKAEAWRALNNQIAAENQRGGPGTQPVSGQPVLNDLRQQLRQAEDARDPVRIAQLRQKIAQSTQTPPSLGMALTSEEEKKRAGEAVETEQKNVATNMAEMKKAKLAAKKYQEAISILTKDKPTGSGFGTGADWLGDKVGVALPGRDAAEELNVLGGWLTANVPRMEGPQSNFDVDNYKTMAGMVGNSRLPRSTRIGAAKKAMQMIMDAAPKEFGSSWSADDLEASGAKTPSLSELAGRELARRKGQNKE